MTLAIVPNINTPWYDPGRISGDPIITQNLNYTGGANTLKSTSKTTIRLLQDSGKRALPSVIRQGLGVGISSPDVTVAVGDAIINGRWVVNTTQLDYDASVLGDGDYYLHLTLTEDSEGESRDPQSESIIVTSTLVGSYGAATSNRIVLAKFSVTSSVPSLVESYTGTPAQWAAAAIVPPISPDGSVYGSVELYSGAIERNLEAVAESDGFRITEKLIIDDTDGTPVGKAHLRNIDQELEARNAPSVDNDYVPFAAKSYKAGPQGSQQEVITSTLALTNIASLNTKAIPVGSSELLDRDTAPSERVKNKEFEDGTTLIVDAAAPTSKMRFEVSGVVPGNTRVVTMIDEDLEIVGRTNEQTLTDKTLTTPTIGPTGWANANHNHTAANRGAQITDAALSSQVTVPKGGTGLVTLEDGGILLGSSTGNVTVSARPTETQILIGQTSGDPEPKTMSGGATMDKEGIVTVVSSEHDHDADYYTETEFDAMVGIGSTNKKWANCIFVGSQSDGMAMEDNAEARVFNKTAVLNAVSAFFEISTDLQGYGKQLVITRVRFYLDDADASNFCNGIHYYYSDNSGSGFAGIGENPAPPYDSIGEFTIDFTDITVATTVRKAGIALTVYTDTIYALEIAHVQIEYYYA